VVYIKGNSQNNRWWRYEISDAVPSVPKHDLKAGIWCAVTDIKSFFLKK
jgi:hypothetical protein